MRSRLATITLTALVHLSSAAPAAVLEPAAPADLGVDPQVLTAADNRIGSAFPAIRSLLVLKNGRLVHERYFSGADGDTPQRVHSITKSVVSLLVGIAIAEGRFPDLETPLTALYPEIAAAAPESGAERVTIRHLLTMTTGQRWSERGESLWRWAFSKDRRRVAVQLPVDREPGTAFHYNTAASDLLGAILADAVGMPLGDYAAEKLFGPLGIADVMWLRRGSDYDNGGAGLMLSPRAMARIGQLVLDQGQWAGRNLVSAAWIAEATRNQVPPVSSTGYGYQWWVRPYDDCHAFRAAGRGGQFIVVVPERGLVIVVTSAPHIHAAGSAAIDDLFEQIVWGTAGDCDPARAYRPTAKRAVDRARGLDRVPPALRPLLEGFTAAVNEGDLERTMGFYSERFSLGGKSKADRRPLWARLGAQRGAFFYTIDTMERVADGIWRYDGHVHGSFGRWATSSHVVEEPDGWRFLGDRWAGVAPPALPPAVSEFLDEVSSAVARGDLDTVAAAIDDGYLANGYRKPEIVDLWRETMRETDRVSFSVMQVEETGAGYGLAGFLEYGEVGRVPMEHLFGTLARRGDRLVWIGNGRLHPAVPAR